MSAARAEPVSRWVVAVAVAGTVAIAAGAFWLSYTALADLAVRSGVRRDQAWVWPLIVDGVIVVATVAVVALHGGGGRLSRYPWLLLIAGALVSVAANVTHAAISVPADAAPVVVAALVAAIPPIVLLAITHLTVELTRTHRDAEDSPAVSASEGASRLPTGGGTKPRTPNRTPRAHPVRPANAQSRAKAAAMRAGGASDSQIARTLGVHRTTVTRWLAAPTHKQMPAHLGGDEQVRQGPGVEGGKG